jgi:hypothetical protein
MREQELTDAKKIEILERIKERLQTYKGCNKRCDVGLCQLLQKEFRKEIVIHIGCAYKNETKEFWFRDFKYENALKFSASYERENNFWWDVYPYDYENRIKFLEWMIERIKSGKESKI